MTRVEKQAIAAAVKRIRELASLENASFFPFDPDHDSRVKDKVALYMTWFEIVADELTDLVEADEPYEKHNALHELLRYE